jgi:hypothetical protein
MTERAQYESLMDSLEFANSERRRLTDELAALQAIMSTDVREALAVERRLFEEAMMQSWRMIDPLCPAGTPGSYARGVDSGIVAALKTVRSNFDRLAALAGRSTLEVAEKPPVDSVCASGPATDAASHGISERASDVLDAKRYRWLREQHEGREELAFDADGLPTPMEPTALAFTVFRPDETGCESLVPVGCIPGELDAAIDAAMSAGLPDPSLEASGTGPSAETE